MRSKRLWIGMLILLAIPAPVAAKHWVTLDYELGIGGYWVDRDSISRSGDLIYHVSAWRNEGQYPDDSTSGARHAYDCRTHYLYNVRDGSLADGFEEPSNIADAYNYVLCR